MASTKDFGKHIQKLRKARGYSQEQLAELVGIEYQSISRIETGLYFTSFDKLQKIAKALNLPLEDLFDFPESEPSKDELIETITSKIKGFETEDLQNIDSMINLYYKIKK